MAIRIHEPKVNVAQYKEEISRLQQNLMQKEQQICSLIAERDRFNMLQYNQQTWTTALEFLQGVINGDADKEIKKEAITQWSAMINKLLFSKQA